MKLKVEQFYSIISPISWISNSVIFNISNLISKSTSIVVKKRGIKVGYNLGGMPIFLSRGKSFCWVYKSVVYYRTLSSIPPQFSTKALAISATPLALKVIPRKSYKL